jgi:DNA-binding GntR family transcriptional regulator
MKIKPVPRITLADAVAGKLAASILDESLKPGNQLPSERELMRQLGVSRTTVREALKILEENHLIEARPGVGWFVCAIDEGNFASAYELAGDERRAPASESKTEDKITLSGPKRLPVTPEKPLHIPNLRTDRLGTFDFISWWEREKVEV